MNRRDLLKYTGAAGTLALLSRPSRMLRAGSHSLATKPARRLIVVMAQGGWDTTYALDPKIGMADKIDVPIGHSQRFGDLDVFVDPSRQAVTDYFSAYAGLTAIVRGISVTSVVHRECVKRMATGTRSEANADIAAIVSHDLGNALPLPYLILGDTAFTGPYAGSAGRVGATNQIIALLDPTQAYRGPDGAAPFIPSAGEDEILSRYANASADRMRATRGALGYNRRRVEDFVESIGRGKKLKGVAAGFGERGRTLALENQVDLALDALEQGISHAAMLNTRLSWDTHNNNEDQGELHTTTFAGLSRLLEGLTTRPGSTAGSKMIDDTMVVCFSEFSRTPRLNADRGKDHWPVTSAMVIGAGVRGGKAYGATSDVIESELVDFTTGARAPNGQTLISNHFVAGVLTACGVDPVTHLGPTEVFDAFVA
ncbi:MAG: DUF1501 domain-containing protein [Kofleriaceae bacterium]